MAEYNVYITTNSKKQVLYTGVTNDLEYRLIEHYLNRGNIKTFAGRYYCYCLIYFEKHHSIEGAIEREKEIKDWNRLKKETLINEVNPEWKFLNNEITPWPPHYKVTKRT
jgi:putative endonuclease